MAWRKNVTTISIYYALIYMTVGGFSSFIGLYYASIHLSNMEIGLLISLGSVIALFAQPIWGILSDRARTKNTILFICLLSSAVSIWLIPLAGNQLWLLIVMTAVFYFFQCAVNPLSDTIALELAGQESFSFSFVRTVGSLGYAFMSVIAGWIFSYNLNYIFAVFSLFMLFSFLFSRSIPSVEGHQKGNEKVKFTELFKNRKLIFLYIFIFLIGSTLGFFFAFHAIYSQEQGIGTHLIGLGVMVGSFSQFPFMLLFDRIYQRYGIVKILLFSGAIHVIRWFLYAYFLNSTTILLIWMLHGGTYILLYLCLAEYVNQTVIKELKASAQMMNSIVLMGISKICGGIIGGYFASEYGFSAIFFVCAAISMLAIIGLGLTDKMSSIFEDKNYTTKLSQ